MGTGSPPTLLAMIGDQQISGAGARSREMLRGLELEAVSVSLGPPISLHAQDGFVTMSHGRVKAGSDHQPESVMKSAFCYLLAVWL